MSQTWRKIIFRCNFLYLFVCLVYDTQDNTRTKDRRKYILVPTYFVGGRSCFVFCISIIKIWLDFELTNFQMKIAENQETLYREIITVVAIWVNWYLAQKFVFIIYSKFKFSNWNSSPRHYLERILKFFHFLFNYFLFLEKNFTLSIDPIFQLLFQ